MMEAIAIALVLIVIILGDSIVDVLDAFANRLRYGPQPPPKKDKNE
ncbi:MAG TPA: hypothetical protein VEP90_22115 [Methylomirabilota bacterium]|nr:hypothetical protein [Methylomirabilota bacterium]